jgi:hypothetical protein
MFVSYYAHLLAQQGGSQGIGLMIALAFCYITFERILSPLALPWNAPHTTERLGKML